MKSAFIESPLGITKVVGDVNGISEISVLNKGKLVIET
jgi:methylated-DNA-[protein]-cysteine S-methyltransferase